MKKISFSSVILVLFFIVWTGTNLNAQIVNQTTGKIVFASKRPYKGNVQWDIYVMNADGTALKNLTKDRYIDSNPEWSPDGSKIVFASKRKRLGWCLRWDIYVMDADGTGEPINRTNDVYVDSDPAWSPPEAFTYVPDNNFERFLIDEGFDDVMDDYVLTANISSVDELFITSRHPITDLTGIEDFYSLKNLYLMWVPIASLDISNNNRLTNLWLEYPAINHLVISEHNSLEFLRIAGLNATTLDVSKNRSLVDISLMEVVVESFNISENNNLSGVHLSEGYATTFDVSKNRSLVDISLRDVYAESFNISENNNLSGVYLNSSGATTMNISNNDELKWIGFDTVSSNEINILGNMDLIEIDAFATSITSLDVSTSTNLTKLTILGDRFLSSLDISNNSKLEYLNVDDTPLNSLDVSNNFYLNFLYSRATGNLTCVKVNQHQLNNIPPDWINDPGDIYSLNCE